MIGKYTKDKVIYEKPGLLNQPFYIEPISDSQTLAKTRNLKCFQVKFLLTKVCS